MRHLFSLLLVLISIEAVAPLTLSQLLRLANIATSQAPKNHVVVATAIAHPPSTTPEVPAIAHPPTTTPEVPATTGPAPLSTTADIVQAAADDNVQTKTNSFQVADDLIATGEVLMETIRNETKAIQAQALAAAQEADRIERVYEFISGDREKYMGIVGDRLVVLERKLFQAGDKLEDMTIKIVDFFNGLKGINDRYKAAINSAIVA